MRKPPRKPKKPQKLDLGGFIKGAGELGLNYLKGIGDAALTTGGAGNVIQDEDYSGVGGNFFKNTANTIGGIGKIVLPGALQAVGVPAAATAAGQQIIGGMNPEANADVLSRKEKEQADLDAAKKAEAERLRSQSTGNAIAQRGFKKGGKVPKRATGGEISATGPIREPKVGATTGIDLTKEIKLNSDYSLIPKGANVDGVNKYNDFLQTLTYKGKPYVNNPALNSPEGQKQLAQYSMDEFNKANPGTPISVDDITALQAYHKLSDPNVIVDGVPGSQFSQMRYPSAPVVESGNVTAVKKAPPVVDRKEVFHTNSDKYKMYDYPDPNAGYSKATRKYYDAGTNNEIDASGSFDETGNYKPKYLGMAEGGKIVGKGTAKSDSINAKVEEDSFVVPAENSSVAMGLKKLLGQDTGKADLKQKGGEKVKLSNGEVLFTPEEVAEITAFGIDLDKLAPDSKSKLRDHLNCGGKVMDYKDGGEVPKFGPGGKVKKSEEQLRKEYLARKRGYENESRKNNGLPPLSDYQPTQEEFEATMGKRTPAVKKVPSYRPAVKKEASVVTPNSNGLTVDQMRFLKPSLDNEVPETSRPTVVPQAKLAGETPITTYGENPTNYSFNGAGLGNNTSSNSPGKPGSNFKLGEFAGEAANYALPIYQLIMGNKALKDAGPRPVDQIDPDYLKSIDAAQSNLAKANEAAKFGFSAEEKFANEQNNQNLLNTGRFAARAYSGGSGASALANERSSINDAYMRGLDAAIADRKLRMAKQDIAYARQKDLDALNLGKAGMNRNLFGDKMSGWQQNQQAGAQLYGTGLDNLIGAGRYSQELAYKKNRDAKYGNIYP